MEDVHTYLLAGNPSEHVHMLRNILWNSVGTSLFKRSVEVETTPQFYRFPIKKWTTPVFFRTFKRKKCGQKVDAGHKKLSPRH